MLLAGGGGTRLNILAQPRAKPAVPFAGMYRIIDFTMSNVMNSRIDHVAVLTQYKPLSLNSHIGSGEAWDLRGRTREAKILPPRTGEAESDWYKGTADAIRQNFDYIDRFDAERVLILSGDHIYRMDYAAMVDYHKRSNADLTVAMMRVPREDVRHFGIGETDAEGRLTAWIEKPETSKSNLASLGIYVFESEYLRRMLDVTGEHDFGHGIIPRAVGRDRVFAYGYNDYWRDVGTIQAYWEANMDLLDPASGIDLASWGLRTNLELEGRIGDRPPALLTSHADVDNSVISPGCHIEGRVIRSVLSPGVHVERGATVTDSVVMHNTWIGGEAAVDRAILDKHVTVGDGATVGTGDRSVPNAASPDHLYTGLVVAGRRAEIPAACTVGRNSILSPFVREEDYPAREIPPGSTIDPLAGRRNPAV